MTLAAVDGMVTEVSDAMVAATDLGLRSGLGVFETVRAVGGRLPPRWADHLARARSGTRVLGFTTPPDDAVTAGVTALLARDGRDDVVVRVTVTAGPLADEGPFPGRAAGTPTVVVTLHDVPDAADAPASGVTVAHPRSLAQVKSTSYADALVARSMAARAGADEAVLVADGCVLEGATSSVAAVVDGRLVTPGGPGLLPGITMAEVLAFARPHDVEVHVGVLPVAVLAAADEALLTSAVRGVRALVRLDATPVGAGRPGPVTGMLAAAWRSARGLGD